jgi:hypothetical protein
MSFAPDFGLCLMRRGASRDTDILLVPFVLEQISVVSAGLFTTISNFDFLDDTYAVSLDFDTTILEDIKRLCSTKTARLIEKELQNAGAKARTVVLPEPVELAVTARLGEVQSAAYEEFLPLVVQSVSKMAVTSKRSKR